MILWFLRCFSIFTKLQFELDSLKSDIVFTRAAHSDLKTESLILKDRVDDLRNRLETMATANSELLNRLDEARKSEIQATRTVTDFIAQLKYGKRIFDSSPDLPEMENLPQAERVLRPQAKDIAREAERQFADSVLKYQANQVSQTPQ